MLTSVTPNSNYKECYSRLGYLTTPTQGEKTTKKVINQIPKQKTGEQVKDELQENDTKATTVQSKWKEEQQKYPCQKQDRYTCNEFYKWQSGK